jgi:Lon protease-like protein
VPVPAELHSVAQRLQRVLQNLRERQAEAAEQLPIQPPYQWDDAAWVANRWAELLPVPLPLKQRLMALDNPLLRLELIDDLLDRLGLET